MMRTSFIALATALFVWLSVANVSAADRYRVVNVPKGDSLSLRQSPDYRSAKLADIPRQSVQVFGHGKLVNVGGARWIKVMAQGKTGWVNARFVLPYNVRVSATASARREQKPLTAELDCLGADPFWTLRTGAADLRLRDAAANTRIWDLAGPVVANGRGRWALSGTSSSRQKKFEGSIREATACPSASDDMAQGLAIEFQLGRSAYRGCCTLVASKPSS